MTLACSPAYSPAIKSFLNLLNAVITRSSTLCCIKRFRIYVPIAATSLTLTGVVYWDGDRSGLEINSEIIMLFTGKKIDLAAAVYSCLARNNANILLGLDSSIPVFLNAKTIVSFDNALSRISE